MAFIAWMQNPAEHKGKPLDLDTQVRYLGKLEPVLKKHGNKVIENMWDDGYSMPQPAGPKPIHALSSQQVKDIQSAVERVRPAKKQLPSWRMAQARIISFIYPATGMRPSELRTVKYKDLNLKEWTIHAERHRGLQQGQGRGRLHGVRTATQQCTVGHLACIISLSKEILGKSSK